jgi:DNA-binding protein H-NS
MMKRGFSLLFSVVTDYLQESIIGIHAFAPRVVRYREPRLGKETSIRRILRMAAINVDKLPLKELLDLETRVKKAIVVARDRERNEVRQEMMALAAKRGLSISEVFNAPRAVKADGKVPVKYRNPENSTETWTGRGRQPKWLAAALKKGAKLEDFAL